MFRMLCCFLFCALLLLIGTAQSQQPQPPVKDPDKKAADGPDKKPATLVPGVELKDPTEPSQKLKEVLTAPTTGPGKSGPGQHYPSVVLRGRIVANDHLPAAILEMDGKLFVVLAGDTLAGPASVIRVISIDSQEVLVEVGSPKVVLRLR